jgi:hypothetical protein
LGLALTGCGDDLDNGRIYLVSGLETDTWTAAPTPIEIEIERVLPDGTRETISTLDVPEEDDTPNFELTGPVSRLVVVGSDADGQAVVRGRSFWLQPDGLKDLSIPLFVGRVGRFSRPGTLVDAAGNDPVVAVVGGRFLLAGGADAGGQVRMSGFDFGFWSPTTTEYYTCPSNPCRAESMAVVAGSVALVIGDDWSYARDFVTNYGQQFPAPAALDSWSHVAGGAAVQVDDGSAYVVGGTRPEPPTATVVRLRETGDVEVAELGSERAGAAATWVQERGLAVVGGSDTAPGVELLAASSTEASALAFAPDPTTGAALTSFDKNLVMRVGGRLPDDAWAPTVVIDLACTSDCSPQRFGEPVELDRAQAFRLSDSVVVVGDDADGSTAVKLITPAGLEDVELREPRAGARAVQNTLDQVLVVGGTLDDGSPARSIELLTL